MWGLGGGGGKGKIRGREGTVYGVGWGGVGEMHEKHNEGQEGAGEGGGRAREENACRDMKQTAPAVAVANLVQAH